MEENKILVHTCCAPCASPSGERLMKDGWDITLFYSNSNIYPKSEYQKRLESAEKLAKIWNVPLIFDSWDHTLWREFIKGYEKDKEGGGRCSLCFEFNLKRTAGKAEELGYKAFTTTLTLGPYKNSKVIFNIASVFPGFMEFNFKKKNGFQRSIELSREYGLYRQSYCGCEFSFRD
ncbi:MAG: epoxyqueuosine reductase QueH [Spirochaetales bacterium]|nr:epoxyqueuosine reductase QueH [Spirochaetales bacterium]